VRGSRLFNEKFRSDKDDADDREGACQAGAISEQKWVPGSAAITNLWRGGWIRAGAVAWQEYCLLGL